jgi:hypothetical protein
VKTTKDQLDLSILPEHAKQELRRFFQFLLTTYCGDDTETHDESTARFAEFLQHSIDVEKIIIYPREALHER